MTLAELIDYLREKKSWAMLSCPKKLVKERAIVEKRHTGKARRGVMMLVKKDLRIDDIKYGQGHAEMKKVGVG